MTTPALVLSVAAALVIGDASSRPVEPDKDSVELIVRGCLKGRELTADAISGHADLEGEVGMIFRLSGKGAVGQEIKQHGGHVVDVTGQVKKTALATPGFKLGGGRIVIGSGGPMSTDPTRNPARNPSRRMVPMEISAIAMVSESCDTRGGTRRPPGSGR